jgi:hypothetical protein
MGKEEVVFYKIMNEVISFFKLKTEKDFIDEYLADASDLVDLENRLRQIDRNQAPWQLKENRYSKCWVQQ